MKMINDQNRPLSYMDHNGKKFRNLFKVKQNQNVFKDGVK